MSSPEADLSLIKELIQALPIELLKDLRKTVHTLIKEREAEREDSASQVYHQPGRHLVDSQTLDGITYQLEKIKCGKPTCRCSGGEDLHGPYWYLYRWNGRKVVSQYIGKSLPKPLAEHNDEDD
ncbi:MAG: DUF6788 family protein [Leptolyngbyaceae bacterium]|nr:DUF6788 family protein [Leptolyngbyaceae bacterium]